MVITDVDDFKEINDTYGHVTGDVVLKEIVGGMIETTREYDTVGRYGGEEFMLILPEVNKAVAIVVCERLRRNIEEREIEIDEGQNISVTASFGIASFDEDGGTPDDLLVKADERLYKAKRAGKNQVVYE